MRQNNCRHFLNDLSRLLNSIGLWASDDGSGANMSLQQRDAEKSFLARKLKDLERGLDRIVKETLQDVADQLSDQIFDGFVPAVQSASDKAVPTASGWGAHRNLGGLYWATYKATCRRNGLFQGASGLEDFNGEL